MNTVRILICVTFALLIAALVHSYSTKGGPKEKSLSELQEELEKVKLENQIKREREAGNSRNYNLPDTVPNYTGQADPVTAIPAIPAPSSTTTQPATFVNPLAPANELDVQPTLDDEVTAKLRALEAENAKLKEKQAIQESENDMLHAEAGAIQKELLTRSKPEEERAAMIAQALVMARVSDYDPNSGIIVLDLERAQNLSTGQILGIRRGSAGGIIGRIRLGNIESSALGYADPIPQSFFGGPVSIEKGDEVIVIP